MKKGMKTIIIVLSLLAFVTTIDFIQIKLFKAVPIFAIRIDNLKDPDSYVYKGLIFDTYYCIKEQDMVLVTWNFKFYDFDCKVE